MNLVYDHDAISIWHAENLPVLRSMADNAVHAVITDPPYATTEEGKTKNAGYTAGEWAVFEHDWDTELQLEWIAQAARTLKPGGSFVAFVDNKLVTTVWEQMERAGLHVLNTLYWHKTNPPTNPRKNFCSSVETALFARKPGKVLHWGGGGVTHNHFECPKVTGYRRLHPTQKPLRLMAWLIQMAVPPEGLILDPFMGAGSTLRAAKNLGRRAVGIERDEGYVGLAIPRMAQEVMRFDDEGEESE